jgi:hypothetical protein
MEDKDRVSKNNIAEKAVFATLAGLSTSDAKELLRDVINKIDDYSTVNESKEPATLA